VNEPPAGRLTGVLILPVPLAGPVPPPAPRPVQLALVMAAGSVSTTVAPFALLGPALETVIVYITAPPCVAVVTPSLLVMLRSAVAPSVSVSVALLLPGVGSVTPAGAATVAVLESVPVAAGEMVAETVKVTDPPTGRLTVSLMLPEPEAVAVPPPAPTAVQVTPVRDAGKVSATVAPVALLGPALDAVIVYVTEPPGVAATTPSVLVMARSAWGVRVSLSVALLLAGSGSMTPPGAVTVAVYHPR
jgi:hypothetical protein